MSDTPRTDELAVKIDEGRSVWPEVLGLSMMLERENVELREKLQIEEERSMYWRENENKLKTENAALLADRDRLDWLEGEDGQSWTAKWYYRGEEWITRAAIDAARKEAKP